MMNNFNVKEATESIIKWIQDWFEQNGKECNAVIGISGGKDSSIVAALLVKALGKDRVIGVRIPNGEQIDIDIAKELCDFLDINSMEINIGKLYANLITQIPNVSSYSLLNIPPRLRMTTLYAVSQSNNGRVIGTGNLSENVLFYSTLWGDSACDMNPIQDYTVSEVIAIGEYLGLPPKFTRKTPADGLPGSCSDEEKFGFSYNTLDKLIRGYETPEKHILEKIIAFHNKGLFKNGVINTPGPKSNLYNYFSEN